MDQLKPRSVLSIHRRLEKAGDPRSMAIELIAILRRYGLKLGDLADDLTVVRGDWDQLLHLLEESERKATSDEFEAAPANHDDYVRWRKNVGLFFEEAIHAVYNRRPGKLKLGTGLNFCRLCGIPAIRSPINCDRHRYDGQEYKRVRRMEHWARRTFGASLTDRISATQRQVRRNQRSNPMFILHGRAAAKYRGEKLKPPRDEIALLRFLLIERNATFIVPSNSNSLTLPGVLTRHEAWLTVEDEYRRSTAGRPKVWMFEDIRPALELMRQGHKRRAAERKFRIPHTTMTHLLKRFETEVALFLQAKASASALARA